MAVVQIIIPQEGTYENDNAVELVINYICRLDNFALIRGIGLYPITVRDMVDQFYIVKKWYRKEKGKQIFHIIFSFDKYLFTAEECVELAYQIAEYWGGERQIVFGVHDDTDHFHIHMGINTVSYTNGNYKAFFPIEDIKNYVETLAKKEAVSKWFNRQETGSEEM